MTTITATDIPRAGLAEEIVLRHEESVYRPFAKDLVGDAAFAEARALGVWDVVHRPVFCRAEAQPRPIRLVENYTRTVQAGNVSSALLTRLLTAGSCTDIEALAVASPP
jgi:hypothetical protein